MNSASETVYATLLGAKLRQVRKSLGLSLFGVEEKSGGRWKAVVVGSYERADRAITVARLVALADWYGVSVRDLLPDEAGASVPRSTAEVVAQHLREALDLLENAGGAS
jgi:transcriptional regulator with XRE-family HTH domain